MVDIASTVEPIQWVTLAVAVAALGFITLRVKSCREDPKFKFWIFPIVLVLLHVVVFYVSLASARYLGIIIPIKFTVWSSILRLHVLITLCGYEAARYFMERCLDSKR